MSKPLTMAEAFARLRASFLRSAAETIRPLLWRVALRLEAAAEDAEASADEWRRKVDA